MTCGEEVSSLKKKDAISVLVLFLLTVTGCRYGRASVSHSLRK